METFLTADNCLIMYTYCISTYASKDTSPAHPKVLYSDCKVDTHNSATQASTNQIPSKLGDINYLRKAVAEVGSKPLLSL